MMPPPSFDSAIFLEQILYTKGKALKVKIRVRHQLKGRLPVQGQSQRHARNLPFNAYDAVNAETECHIIMRVIPRTKAQTDTIVKSEARTQAVIPLVQSRNLEPVIVEVPHKVESISAHILLHGQTIIDTASESDTPILRLRSLERQYRQCDNESRH